MVRRLQCGHCQGEVAPSDKFCGHCRHNLRLHPALSRPLKMLAAPVWRRLGATLFDGLAWLMLVRCFFEFSGPQPLFLIGFWAGLVECRDGCTPGQQIFSLKRLSKEGEALTWRGLGDCLRAAYIPWAKSPTRLYWVPQR